MGAQFNGSMTALITPMRTDGSIDEQAFQDFVRWQIDQGAKGVIPVGTTGESPTLNHDEHRRVVELCIEAAEGKAWVIAGTGSNSTSEAVSLTKHAKLAGADAALVVTPYYNKPTQEGMYQHYAAVARSADIPIIIYNIPGRSVVDMSVETMARLAQDFGNIVGVKDATNDLNRPVLTRLALGDDFVQLSGEDGTIGAFLGQGGHGCISVTSNIAPALCAQLHQAWQQRALDTFEKVRDTLMPVHKALFCESSPGPVKYAASLLGKCTSFCRLPMTDIAESSKVQVRTAMQGAGLLAS